MLGPLSQAESKKRMNQAITINECMNVMSKRAIKASFNRKISEKIFFTPKIKINRTIQAYKNVDTPSSKSK